MNSNPETIESGGEITQTRMPLTPPQEITWIVRKVNSLPKTTYYSLDSPPFGLKNATWCLRLYPNSHYYPDDGSFGIKIVRLSSRVPHHKLQYYLKSMNNLDNIFVESAYFDEDHKECCHMTIFNIRKWIFTDDFGVIFQVCFYGSQLVDVFSQTEIVKQDKKDVDNLGQSFKDLLLNGQRHDVVLKVMDKEFRAHQDVLRVRSPVLESMLSHDMLEKNSGVIDIPDCDPDAFAQFLLFIYSGEVETLDAGNMLALYYVADKYDVSYLKAKCREFIKNSLTSTNVSDIIQIALDHTDTDLLESAKEYFVKHVDEVLRTVEWQSFLKRSPIQANELFIVAIEKVTALIKKG